MTPEEARQFFPHLSTGRIFLDHASNSPLSERVVSRIYDYLNQRSVTHVENFFDYLPIFESAQNRLAKLINADADRISWRDNVTSGLNLLAQSLDWNEGDRIILNDLEFPANVYPFLNLRSKGVEIEFAKSHNGKVDLEQIEPLVNEKTKLISISSVQFLSGYRADLDAIGKFCKQKDIIFCVDGIQGIGAVDLDVKSSKIDYLSGGSHKWLMGLKGLGYSYITKELQEKIKPAYVGWLGVENAWDLLDYKLELREDAGRFQTGTVNAAGLAAIDASLELMEEIGYKNIESQIISNSKYLMSKLQSIGIEPILTNVNDSNLAGIVTSVIDNAQIIHEELLKRKINTAYREGMIRISPHYYNSKDELDLVVGNLKELI